MTDDDSFSLQSSNSMPSNHDDEPPMMVFGVEYIPGVPRAIFIPACGTDTDHSMSDGSGNEDAKIKEHNRSVVSKGSSKGSRRRLGRKLRSVRNFFAK